MNVLAVVTFVLGLCGLAILPVVLGHISLSQIKRRNERGGVFAVIGLVLGYCAIAVYIVLAIVVALSIAAGLANR